MTDIDSRVESLAEDLDTAKSEQRAAEDQVNMPARIAHIYEHHIHRNEVDHLIQAANRTDYAPLAICAVIVAAVSLGCWLFATPPTSSSTYQQPASLAVADATACFVWCTERSLLVTRVQSDGCECIDSEGEPVEMTWAYGPEHGRAGLSKVNFELCVEEFGK